LDKRFGTLSFYWHTTGIEIEPEDKEDLTRESKEEKMKIALEKRK